MPTCPNGHQSGSDDWCEVCGHRMAVPGASPGTAPPPPPGYGYPAPAGDPHATAQAELCPQCRTPREAMAPFCEECRYNFLTHTATSYTPIAPAPHSPSPGLNLPSGFTSRPPGPPAGPQASGHDPYDYQGSRPSRLNRPAEPLGDSAGPQQFPPPGPAAPFPQGPGGLPGAGQQGPPPVFQQQSAPPAPPQHQQQPGADDWMLPPPDRSQPPGPGPGQQQFPPPGPAAPFPQGPGQQGPGQQGMPQQHPGSTPGQHQSPPSSSYPASDGWTAVIAPDREYFMAMMQRSGPDAGGLNLPAYSPEQHLTLTGNQITIGRRRQSTGESPDIDLSVPPEDPGVSHKHAVLVQQPDGSWAVVDQNSTNGTTLNGAEEPIQPYVPVQLNDGDRVHVGAWTTITVRRG
ncbi:FHA domain-containing protein [Streptomyces katsurahamanus]|uniref:FHA domain-containing protein n=1 Tax=Streptomyces katsurahamanus TaxID=2577098 RepID=A0ABW9NNB5_9ACTN|nr:FHA domain-containing protein [Streptomyces katsurahamanus]MQS34805.1 FHA domain-containing protein [Streptomyces katsurahamanus]